MLSAIGSPEHTNNMSTEMNASARRRVLVWDLPTRLFHWMLVALVAIAWSTGGARSWFSVHTLAGFGIAILVLSRIAWGFVGSPHSRFRDFVSGPAAAMEHARALGRLRPPRALGHNPLGGWMVLALLGVLAVVVGTGMFAGGRHIAGPLAAQLSPGVAHAVKEVHELLVNLLLVLVAGHLGGVAVESLLTRENLVRSMLTGLKWVPVEEAMADAPPPAHWWRAALVLVCASGLVWLLVS